MLASPTLAVLLALSLARLALTMLE
jgi:hypothetical protein